MRKLFVALLAATFVLSPLHAALNPAAARETPAPKPAAPEAQGEKKPSWMKRMFGPSATPTPAPTPDPVVKRRPRPKATPATGVPPTVEKVPEKVTPAPGPRPKPAKSTSKKGTPPAADSTGADDATKFKAAKSLAQDDPHLKELKSKADGEVNEAEAHKALVNYNRALFQKIREIDPSVSDYAGKVEQSMTKRIGSEKGNE
jgi:hypothetical protein